MNLITSDETRVVDCVLHDTTGDTALGVDFLKQTTGCEKRSLDTFYRPPALNVRGQVVGKTTSNTTQKQDTEIQDRGRVAGTKDKDQNQGQQP